MREILARNVDELELSVRSNNCLKMANIKTIGDLVRKSEAEMLKYKNFGRKSLREIAEILEGMGLHFGTDITPYQVPEIAEEGKGAPATPAAVTTGAPAVPGYPSPAALPSIPGTIPGPSTTTLEE
jgi:DNA-directed RNA polymerase subunit alpha